MIRALVLTLVLMTPFLVGCDGASGRPDLHKVTGSVTFKGSPVEGANVTFSSATSPRSATGATDASGKFSLTTFDTNDGAVVGEHAVTITKVASGAESGAMSEANAKEMMAKNMGTMNAGKSADSKPDFVLPAKYADAKTSKEKRTVSATDTNDFKFDLTE